MYYLDKLLFCRPANNAHHGAYKQYVFVCMCAGIWQITYNKSQIHWLSII